jgi:hypothetical protein
MKNVLRAAVSGAISNPEAVKVVGVMGAAGNFMLWLADNANILVAVSTLIITWLMFMLTSRKLRLETEIARRKLEQLESKARSEE